MGFRSCSEAVAGLLLLQDAERLEEIRELNRRNFEATGQYISEVGALLPGRYISEVGALVVEATGRYISEVGALVVEATGRYISEVGALVVEATGRYISKQYPGGTQVSSTRAAHK